MIGWELKKFNKGKKQLGGKLEGKKWLHAGLQKERRRHSQSLQKFSNNCFVSHVKNFWNNKTVVWRVRNHNQNSIFLLNSNYENYSGFWNINRLSRLIFTLTQHDGDLLCLTWFNRQTAVVAGKFVFSLFWEDALYNQVSSHHFGHESLLVFNFVAL